MFNHPGSKIKGLAKVLFVLFVIAFSISGVITIYLGIDSEEYWLVAVGVLGIGLGILIAWLSVLFMFAYGSLVDDVQNIRTKLEYMSYQQSYLQNFQQPGYQPPYQQSYPQPDYPQDYQP